MHDDPDTGREHARPRQEGTASTTETIARRPEKRTGAYVVIDTESHDQHARGLSKARAETLANEYADHIVARRERPDPHWLTRARLAADRLGGGSGDD